MNRILLQPSGGAEAKLHFGDTIDHLVPIDRIVSGLNDPGLAARIREQFPEGSAAAWGLTPARGAGIWPELKQGDVVLFAGDNLIFRSATLVEKIHSAVVARELWNVDPDGYTWEYMYLLTDIRGQRIHVPEVAATLGYKPKWVVRSAQLLTPEQSKALDERFSLFSDFVPPAVSLQEFDQAIGQFDPNAPLDQGGYTNFRKEQGFLRKALFGTNTHWNCAICGERLPISLLVAAHIKKRSLCSDAEKRDTEHVVAPMCTFGCDALFERGFISAKDGKVIVGKRADSGNAITAHLGKVVTRDLTGYKPGQEKHYESHRSHHRIEA